MAWNWPWGRKARERKIVKEQAKLSGLIRGIMSAVQSASDIAGQQHFDLLGNYFVHDKDGQIQPKCIRVEMADGRTMDVPLICLMNPASYHLAELDIEMAIRLKHGEVKRAIEKGVDKAVAHRQSYHVEMGHANAKDAVKLKIKFKADDQMPEGFNRLIEELQNTYVTPAPKGQEATDRALWMPSESGSGTGKTVRLDQGALEPNPPTEEHEPLDQ